MQLPSQKIVNFSFMNQIFHLNIDNNEWKDLYVEKLTNCLTKLYTFLYQSRESKLDDNIFYGLAQGLVNRFDDIVNSLGELNAAQFSLILNDIANNYLQAAMVALHRIQNDWLVVCKIAFKEKNIQANTCQLTSIRLMSADPHNAGQVPWECEITKLPEKIKRLFFYKPTPVLIDMLLSGNTRALHELNLIETIRNKYKVPDVPLSFAEITHDPSHLANLTTYLIVPMKDRGLNDPTKLFDLYGYMEFLIADNKHNIVEYNIETHRHYSMQAGKVAAALVCGIPDIHYDNLLICLKNIYVIDSENSLIPASPNPEATQLFRSGLGGFYGDYQEKPNRLLYRRNNNVEKYIIQEPEFMLGANQLLRTLIQQTLFIRRWLEHPLFLQAPLRVIPVSTSVFYELRRDVLEQRMQRKSIDQIRLIHINNLLLPNEVSHLQNTPNDTYSDREMQSVIFIGNNNLRLIIASLFQGDIPTYYMLANNRVLLTLNSNPIILPNGSVPINYFLHIPGQALHDRLQYLQYFPVYRDVLLNCLQYHLTLINDILSGGARTEALTAKSAELRETADLLYRFIDYCCVLSYLAITSSREQPNTNFINNILGLNNLMTSISQEITAQTSQETRLTTVDITPLTRRAQELLQSFHADYVRGVDFAGRQYRFHGRIMQTYDNLMHLLQLENQAHRIEENPATGQSPKVGLRMGVVVRTQESEKKEPPKPSDSMKP